ncbi:flagella biosynthesis regulatory protein FliZ [Providencia rettgeri]|nr:flagella biosynthesis regulatory protein FliZ [Providencia rettgeri]
MVREKSKIRTLRQYLIEFKRKPHRCTNCQAKLNRVSLILDGVAIDKDDISNLAQRLNDEEWHALQTTRLKVLCRFCSELLVSPLTIFFDLVNFQRYLLSNSSMSPSTVREYLTRLRRIETLLVTLNINMSQFNVDLIMAILSEHYSGTSLKNAMSALNKYAKYAIEYLACNYDTECQK